MTAIPLLLVDGHYPLHRAFFGFATRIFTRDKNTDRTGVFGFAALTTRARGAGRPVDIMSTDKDYIQLLADPAVRLLNTGLAADLRYTVGEHIRPRYGVLADQWPDYQALTGDPDDNIAGIRGIGPKTAALLLAGGRRLEHIPARELRHAWAEQWPQAQRWPYGLPLGGTSRSSAVRIWPGAAERRPGCAGRGTARTGRRRPANQRTWGQDSV
ncbi:5'-3' exonuclease H3TH domain-containing protein [Streptomyces lavendulocolor]|uniref:5'-3' exonuclease H3TH domain-containing protein n=1 Tax=Streptomyces lavendulocolor TaxID=67316 RepID=UPI0033F4C4DB